MSNDDLPVINERSLHAATLGYLDGAVEALQHAVTDESVHAARKACKRARAGLRLLKRAVGPRRYRRENAVVRDAGKPLTAVRDAFVLRGVARAFARCPMELRRALDEDYFEERKRLTAGGARRAVELLNGCRERLKHAVAPPADERQSALRGIKKSYKAGRRARRAAARGDDECLHEWRKQTKYLLNELDLLDRVFRRKPKKLLRRAEKLGQVLGDDHDLRVLLERVRKLKLSAPRLRRRIARDRHKLQGKAARLGEKLYRRSARRFEQRLNMRLATSAIRAAAP